VAGGFVVILMIITDPKAEDVNLVELPVRFLVLVLSLGCSDKDPTVSIIISQFIVAPRTAAL